MTEAPVHDQVVDPDGSEIESFDIDAELEKDSEEARARADSIAERIARSVADLEAALQEAGDNPGLRQQHPLEVAVTRVHLDPLQTVGDDSVSPRVETLRAAVTARLRSLAGEANVDQRRMARAMLGANVLGVGSVEQADAALSSLWTYMHDPANADAYGTAFGKAWTGSTEGQFWTNFALAIQGSADLSRNRLFNLTAMSLVAELSPLTEEFSWRSAADQAAAVDTLVRAATRSEAVDLVALYRAAAALTYGKEPVPRAVTAELVQLALAGLSRPDRPTRLKVLATDTPDGVPDQLAREDLRESASQLRDLVPDLAANSPFQDRESRRRVEDCRYSLDQYWSTATTGVLAVLDGQDDGAARRKSLARLLERSRLPTLLQAWGQAVRGSDVDTATTRIAADLVEAMNDLHEQLQTAYGSFGVNATEASVDKVVGLLADEVRLEAADLLAGRTVSARPGDGPRSELGSLRVSTEAFGRAREALAKGTLVKFWDDGVAAARSLVGRAISPADVKQWLQPARDALANVAPAFDQGDLDTIDVALHSFAEAAPMFRARAEVLRLEDPAGRNALTRLLDASTLSLCDGIDALLDAGSLDGYPARLPKTVDALRASVLPLPVLSDPGKAWSEGKGALLDKIDDKEQAKALDKVFGAGLGDALTKWSAQASRSTASETDLALDSWELIDILRRYQRGVRTILPDGRSRTEFLDLIDQVSASVQAALAQAGGVSRPPM